MTSVSSPSLRSIFILFLFIFSAYAYSSSYYESVDAILKNINYYEILKLKSDASIDEIKRSFRSLALEYHPDKNKDNLEKFNLILAAKDTLTDESKRREYDDLLLNGIPAHVKYYGRYAYTWGAPEHDIRWVLFITISLLTISKYIYEWYNHKRSIEDAKKTHHYKTKLNAHLQEKGIDPKKYKKMLKNDPNDPRLKDLELEVIVHGAEAPTIWDLLPLAVIIGIFNCFKWIFWTKLLNKGPTEKEQFKAKLEQFYNKELTDEEVEQEILKIEQRNEKLKSSNKYKRALRYWKKNQ